MTDNTYDRFMIRRVKESRRTIVEPDDDYVDDENMLFVQINGAFRCRIALHVTLTKKKGKKRDGKDTKYFLRGECKVFRNKTMHLYLECADTDVVRNEMCVCYPKTNLFLF